MHPRPVDLVGGLNAMPGCLGVETARTESGRNMIFAWFKDKQSVQRWYYSETHQSVIDLAVDRYDDTKPLAHVPDDAGPIMVIASLVMADKPHLDGLNLPISEISTELYEALPGCVFLGGRFAPKDVKIEHMRDSWARGKKTPIVWATGTTPARTCSTTTITSTTTTEIPTSAITI